MNLLDLRKQFIQISGRYDLVVDTTTWVDNGANFFINAGQMYLDQKGETKRGDAVYYKKLVAGNVGCNFPDCRAIREVWFQDQTEGVRVKLEKKSKVEIMDLYKDYYGQQVPAAQETYGPLYYYLPTLRVYPDNITIAQIESYIGFMDSLPSSGSTIYNGLIVMPASNHEIVLEVYGLFSSPTFVADTDETFWSMQYPIVLLWAALRELEITYRNTEGAKDWENAIVGRLMDIDKDNVEEIIADVNQMEG